jgi:hypothetical protein
MRTLNILTKKTPRAEMAADSAIQHATPLSPSEPIVEIVDAVDLFGEEYEEEKGRLVAVAFIASLRSAVKSKIRSALSAQGVSQ